ncbi:MAG TPA: hypothetical protein VHD90_24710 [Phototrophicaceae bacterium]|nr:hypothetical protein [Phototrophicaceae bacterium]
MAVQNDIVAYSALGQLVLVVEVRTKRSTDSRWAAGTRQILLENALVSNAPYFLLALPDHFYLWVNKQRPELASPDYVIDPAPLLKPYFGTDGVPEYLTENGFELVIRSWLNELMQAADTSDDWLKESGLFDALKRGYLAYEIAI